MNKKQKEIEEFRNLTTILRAFRFWLRCPRCASSNLKVSPENLTIECLSCGKKFHAEDKDAFTQENS